MGKIVLEWLFSRKGRSVEIVNRADSLGFQVVFLENGAELFATEPQTTIERAYAHANQVVEDGEV